LFRDADKRFDVEAFEHACRLWTIALEVSVLMAQFPSEDDAAELSYRSATLGLGLCQHRRLPVASAFPMTAPRAAPSCGAISAIMTGVAYATSAEKGQGGLGPFPGYSPTHRTCCAWIPKPLGRAAYGYKDGFEKPSPPARWPLDRRRVPGSTAGGQPPSSRGTAPSRIGQEHGYRQTRSRPVDRADRNHRPM
jgi:ribonucleoside-diphosphate reductase alpha chain